MNKFKKCTSLMLVMILSMIVSCGGPDDGSGSSPPPPPVTVNPNPGPNNFPNPGQLLGPNAVNLRGAGNYVILAESGVSTVATSIITGDVAVSPAAASYISGFSLIADASNVFSISSQVTGKLFAADMAVPSPSNLTTAVTNMGAAYNDAQGRPTPDASELGGGDISGLTLQPGLYKWSTDLNINTDVTFHGGANDVLILQIAGKLTVASNKKIILTGGLQAKNIFFAVADVVTIGTGAHFEGVILASTMVQLSTGASINGALYAGTAVVLQQATVVKSTN